MPRPRRRGTGSSAINGVWDHDVHAEASAWCDAYARPGPYPDPIGSGGAPDPAINPWRFARHLHRVTRVDPDTLTGRTPYAYDELIEGVPAQTRAKWRRLAAATEAPSYAAVAWTFSGIAQDLVLGIREGYFDNPASALTIAPEFFVFGDDPVGTGNFQMSVLDWYDSQSCPRPDGSMGVLSERIAAIYCVSDAAHLSDRYAHAYSENPGAVWGQWVRLLRAMRDRGRYDAWLWGAGYRHVGEVPGTPSRAVAAWDTAVGCVYATG